MRAALPSAALLALALACGDDADEGPARALVDDVTDIQRVMADDLAVLSLEEVEEAVADDLPARAGELLEAGAIPATRRQREALTELEMATEEGAALRYEAVELLDQRKAALQTYRDLLARGLLEDDLAMLDALSAQRRAEESITAFFSRLGAIHPLPEVAGDEASERRVRRPQR